MSADSGPVTLNPNFCNFEIAGMIILISSEFCNNSALWGLRPKIPILGFLLKSLRKSYCKV